MNQVSKQWVVVRAGVLVLVTLVGVQRVSADGFRNPPGSAEGLGMVGARYTLIDDASSSAYNPANLMDVEKSDLLLSITVPYSDKDYTSPMGQKAHVKKEWPVLPSAYLAWPLSDHRATAAIGVTTPYGQSTEYEKTSVFRYTAPYFAQMRTVNFNPTVACRLGDNVDVGVGLDVMWSDLDLRQIFPWGAVTGNPMTPDGTAKFQGDGVGVGGNAGITWRFAERQRLALVYRSAMDVDYEGDFKVSNIPPGVPALPRSDFDSKIKFPNMVAVGYGIDVNDRLSVGAEVEWFEWSRYKDITLDAGADAPLIPNATIQQKWDDTWNFGLGGSYKLDDTWTARAGYIHLQTPVPESTMLPALAENDQDVFTVGLGCRKGAHRLELAYGLGLYDDRNVTNNQNPAYNGKYTFQSHLFALSYGLVF